MQKIDVKLSHNPEKITGLDVKPIETQDEISLQDLMTSRTSYYIDSLNSHNLLNSSLSYLAVSKQLMPLSTTFPMVVNNMEKIVSIIVENMTNSDQHCTSALIEFVIALIKDARHFIFPLFLSKIMPTLIKMIRLEAVENLNNIFTSFAYAFKFLQKSILQNLSQVYLCYYELLANNNKYIRKFASESFSFILRAVKRRQIKNSLEEILNPLRNPQNYLELPQTDLIEDYDFSLKNTLIQIKAAGRDQSVDTILEGLISKNRIISKDKLFTSHTLHNIIIATAQLITEIIQGTQGKPHSKAQDYLVALLSNVELSGDMWLSVAYIARYVNILLLEYLDQDQDKILSDSMEIAYKSVFSIFFFQGVTKNMEESSEILLNLIVIMWKEWIILKEGKKMGKYCTERILLHLNFLVCENPHFYNLSYVTQKNILECLSLFFMLKYQDCLEIFQLNIPLQIKSKANFYKKQLYELNNPTFLYEFIKCIDIGYNSVLRMNQLVGDYSLTKTLSAELSIEKRKGIFDIMFDSYAKSTVDLLLKPDIQTSGLRFRFLYLVKLMNILKRKNIRIKPEEIEGLFKLLAKANLLWENLIQPSGDNVFKNENISQNLLDICLFLDISSNLAVANKEKIDQIKQLLSSLMNIIVKHPQNEIMTFDPTATYSKEIENQYYTMFAFDSYVGVSLFFYYVLAFSRAVNFLIHAKQDNETIKYLLPFVCKVLPTCKTNVHFLTSMDSLLQTICKIDTEGLIINPDTHKIIIKENSDIKFVYESLGKNLICNRHDIRQVSLKLLNSYFEDSAGCNIIKLMHKIEELDIGLETEKQKLILFKDLKLCLRSKKICVQ